MSHTTHIVLRDVRCVYPRLFKPEEYMGKSNYSIGLLLPKAVMPCESLSRPCSMQSRASTALRSDSHGQALF